MFDKYNVGGTPWAVFNGNPLKRVLGNNADQYQKRITDVQNEQASSQVSLQGEVINTVNMLGASVAIENFSDIQLSGATLSVVFFERIRFTQDGLMHNVVRGVADRDADGKEITISNLDVGASASFLVQSKLPYSSYNGNYGMVILLKDAKTGYIIQAFLAE